MSGVREAVGRAARRIRTAASAAIRPVRIDLAADPRLRYVFLLALATAAFGLWFRVPNFAGPDEYSRLLHPMKPVGRVAGDPGFAAFRQGLLDGRALGATFYLYALVLAPVFVLVVLTGQIGTFTGLGGIESRWTLWHAVPDWFWTASVLLGRLVSVALAVVCVYLTYRLGVRLRDRLAGQVAAVALALSLGFVAQAHVLGEGLPMLTCLLGTVVLAVRYAETGSTRTFLAGAALGGLAIAFKLSGGTAAVALGVAHLHRARASDDPWGTLLDPRVVLGGAAVGLATVVVGIPSVLVGGPGELLARATSQVGSKTGRAGGLDAPITYWFVRQYVQGMGVVLFPVALGGTAATLAHQMRREEGVDPLVIVLVATAATFLVVYSRWEFVRARHIVPTIPTLAVCLGATASRWHASDRRGIRFGVRVALGLALLTSAAFVGVAEYGYVTEQRDEATTWIAENVNDSAEIEVYENSIADVATPHGREVVHYDFQEENATNSSSLVLDEAAFTAWMVNATERRPEYIQLTANELAYADPTNPASDEFPRRRAFVSGLLDGEYDYTVVAEFGEWAPADSLGEDFREAALSPEVEGQEEYVVILRRE